MNRTLMQSFTFLALLVMLGGAVWYQKRITRNITLNEVSFANNNGQDWIEIYNPKLHAVNLKGMYLTDDSKEPQKYQIEQDIALNPKSFVVIGGQGSDDTLTPLQANFGLKNGETLSLFDTDGVTLIDTLPLVAADETRTQSVGRFPDGESETFTFSTLTPGDRNKKDKP